MTYRKLKELLTAEDVYDRLKEQEEALFAFIPELAECRGFDQKNSWHIYDVYEHILHVVAGVEAAELLRLAALFHDIGKPRAFTLDADGVGHFFGHWDCSLEIFEDYVPAFGLSEAEAALVRALIFYHDINVDHLSDEEVAEMTERIGREKLAWLFAIKRADLLAQAPMYHGLLENIARQEERVVRGT